MFRTYDPPELILPISYGDLGELAGWPRQLRSSTGEVAAYLVERRWALLSVRGLASGRP